MRDENFDAFIEEFGEANLCHPVPQSSIDKWTTALPPRLLTYWREEGWCGYADGLFWTVNPDDYEAAVSEWLKDTPLEGIDQFHVIARTAFGKLYLWGERSGSSATILTTTQSLVGMKGDLARTMDDPDIHASSFFVSRYQSDANLKDETGKELFARAPKKYGPVGVDEMYAFVPAIAAGGRLQLSCLQKVGIQAHLTMLRQFGRPALYLR